MGNPNIPDFLEVIQEDAHLRLSSDPVFKGLVPVLLQRKGDIESDVATALSVLNEGDTHKIGACVIILMPDFDATAPGTDAPIGDAVLTARVLVAPLYNDGESGTGLSAEMLALRALRVLCFKCERTGTLLQAKGDAVRPYTADQKAGIVGYDVTVRGQAGIKTGDKCALCTIGGTLSAVTITCTQSGATILYTTDGTYPGSANSAASTYSAAFPVSSGTLVRASAEHPDLVSSEPASKTF